MNSIELLKSGKLSEARGQLADDVKASPANGELRSLLFKVLAFCGEWDKALLHLDLVCMQDPGRAAQAESFRKLIAAEKAREEVHLNKRVPDFLAEPPPFLNRFLEARKELDGGKGERLSSLLGEIEEIVSPVSGQADGVSFEGIFDLDSTLLPFLEVFIHDQYLWFPFYSLRELSIKAPESLLDLLWSPARIVTWDGLTTECVLPVLYPGSAGHADDQIRMGRATDWETLAQGVCRGVGQHLLLVGEEEKGLLELRELTFNFPKGA